MKSSIAITAALGLGLLAVPAVASATTGHTTGSSAHCNTDWYQNPDEGNLKPKQLRSGMLFDGPSLAHHKTAVTLATVPNTVAVVTAGQVVGTKPLLKLETSSPYSTVNKGTTGWWSSKITTGPGSQNQPVASPADLAGLAPYGQATTVVSFGVGYANDTGNKALVTAVYFGRRYSLACAPAWQPPAHHKPTPGPKPTHTAPDTTAPGEAPAPTPVHSDLPVTG